MTEREIIALFHSKKENGKSNAETLKTLDSLDDCALIEKDKVVSCDSMVENVHFRMEWSSPEDLAIKLFQSNLSDVISSGAKPSWCLLNLGLPEHIVNKAMEEKFLERFASSLRQECWRNHAPLVGGDTFRSEILFLSLTMGAKLEGHYIQRKGAQNGDHLYVTGDLGLSLAGLRYLEGKLELDEKLQSHALEKHLQPHARATWAQSLHAMPEIRAMTDLSDGLLSDSIQLAHANQMEIHIDLDEVPLNPDLNGKLDARDAILSGEEFELLFFAPKGLSFPFPCKSVGWGKKVKEGESGVRLKQKGVDVPFPLGRFEHF